jgi:hypothetical protein
VYEKESQSRSKAIEETRQQKLRQQNEAEKMRFMSYLDRQVQTTSGLTNTPKSSAGAYEVDVNGIRFRVVKNGSKLVKLLGRSILWRLRDGIVLSPIILGDTNSPLATPKVATVGGVKFYRSKNGNLYRDGIIKAHRYVCPSGIVWSLIFTTISSRSGTVKKVDLPCKIFSTIGIQIPLQTLGSLFRTNCARRYVTDN